MHLSIPSPKLLLYSLLSIGFCVVSCSKGSADLRPLLDRSMGIEGRIGDHDVSMMLDQDSEFAGKTWTPESVWTGVKSSLPRGDNFEPTDSMFVEFSVSARCYRGDLDLLPDYVNLNFDFSKKIPANRFAPENLYELLVNPAYEIWYTNVRLATTRTDDDPYNYQVQNPDDGSARILEVKQIEGNSFVWVSVEFTHKLSDIEKDPESEDYGPFSATGIASFYLKMEDNTLQGFSYYGDYHEW